MTTFLFTLNAVFTIINLVCVEFFIVLKWNEANKDSIKFINFLKFLFWDYAVPFLQSVKNVYTWQSIKLENLCQDPDYSLKSMRTIEPRDLPKITELIRSSQQ